jgi:hypothetical protein
LARTGPDHEGRKGKVVVTSEEERYKVREVEWIAFELGVPIEEARQWVERRRS